MFGILLLKFIYSPDTPSIELHSTINKLGPIEMTACSEHEIWKLIRLDIVEHDSYKIHKTLQTKLHKAAFQQQMEETLMPKSCLVLSEE